MKLRPASTTSERELLLAMAGSGRSVSLATLADWRKEGLLPPFTTQGLGQGKGKTFFWREADIVSQARLVYDLIQRNGRADNAIILILWLSGFSCSLLQFRRAWFHRARKRKPWISIPAAAVSVPKNDQPEFPLEHIKRRIDAGPDSALLAAIFTICATLIPEQSESEIDIVSRVANQAWLKIGGNPIESKRNSVRVRSILIRVVWLVLESSNLISVASDAEMNEAQRYLILSARFVQYCSGDAEADMDSHWSPELADAIGTPLLLFILVLIRLGYQAELNLTGIELDKLLKNWATNPVTEGAKQGRSSVAKSRIVRTFRLRLAGIWPRLFQALLL